MRPLDRFIQKLRINKAGKYIHPNSRLLDIGCADGAIFLQIPHKIQEGIGIDPGIQSKQIGTNVQIIQGFFPDNLPHRQESFDVVTLLAVLEHIPLDKQSALAKNIFEHLNSQGLLIITVPSPYTDIILNILKQLHLIDGMSLDEHFGFDVKTVKTTFTKYGFTLMKHEYFQLGLNNLFVFKKP